MKTCFRRIFLENNCRSNFRKFRTTFYKSEENVKKRALRKNGKKSSAVRMHLFQLTVEPRSLGFRLLERRWAFQDCSGRTVSFSAASASGCSAAVVAGTSLEGSSSRSSAIFDFSPAVRERQVPENLFPSRGARRTGQRQHSCRRLRVVLRLNGFGECSWQPRSHVRPPVRRSKCVFQFANSRQRFDENRPDALSACRDNRRALY